MRGEIVRLSAHCQHDAEGVATLDPDSLEGRTLVDQEAILLVKLKRAECYNTPICHVEDSLLSIGKLQQIIQKVELGAWYEVGITRYANIK